MFNIIKIFKNFKIYDYHRIWNFTSNIDLRKQNFLSKEKISDHSRFLMNVKNEDIFVFKFEQSSYLISLKKLTPLPGFEPGTSQVPIRYATNWAILAWVLLLNFLIWRYLNILNLLNITMMLSKCIIWWFWFDVTI